MPLGGIGRRRVRFLAFVLIILDDDAFQKFAMAFFEKRKRL